ncbi:MAG: hypothetical protein AB7V13_26125 [Pseudorhodoplanes sp.]|uniref:hypothetical protein n=1 Tax=Pseudorhodoplanes sp. TaxID=1934341 RepID=UPI003D130148
MANRDRNADRPPLDPADLYRPRLGAQREPLSKTIMSELRAWRAETNRTADPRHAEQAA